MKFAIILALFSLAYLAHSSAIGKSFEDAPPNYNLIDSDLSKTKNSRIVNQPQNELVDPGSTWVSATNHAAITTIFLPMITFLATFLVKSKLAIVHLLFGIVFGIIGTVSFCNSTSFCSISANPNALPVEPIMRLLTPDNLGTMVEYANNAIQTYEAVRKLN